MLFAIHLATWLPSSLQENNGTGIPFFYPLLRPDFSWKGRNFYFFNPLFYKIKA